MEFEARFLEITRKVDTENKDTEEQEEMLAIAKPLNDRALAQGREVLPFEMPPMAKYYFGAL